MKPDVAFNDFGHFQPAKSYLFAKGIDRLPPFLPVLTELAEGDKYTVAKVHRWNLILVSSRNAGQEVGAFRS